ncbi:MAG: leucyl/phenylalanyl-tRNA--protein transferase [Campylobacter sp.]|nr:leucyl/phenylalanyl-tRNA--protein transferase [Campylobacter sp.]
MNEFEFPDPNLAPDNEPFVVGGELSTKMLLKAYKSGYFPWFMKGDPVLWWSPNPRAIFYPQDVKLHKSTKKYLSRYSVKFDHNFNDLINLCYEEREKEGLTWLTKDIVKAYSNLAKEGIAHSVEVYDDDKLIGGIYGLIIGRVFCGESMISIKTDASKVALYTLAKALKPYGFIIDAQVINPHLEFMGAIKMKRSEFINLYYKLINSKFDINFKELSTSN